jgi:hypothetical protein
MSFSVSDVDDRAALARRMRRIVTLDEHGQLVGPG